VKVQLSAVSPIAFSMVKSGDVVRIERKPPRKNEYREKIGPPTECYLVVKGQTKIGMIPALFVKEHLEMIKRKFCKIQEVDAAKQLIIITLDFDIPSKSSEKFSKNNESHG
jgi:hypothetical protein